MQSIKVREAELTKNVLVAFDSKITLKYKQFHVYNINIYQNQKM